MIVIILNFKIWVIIFLYPRDYKFTPHPEYINTKCLTIELTNHNSNSYSIIKEIGGVQKCVNFNSIVISENPFTDMSMLTMLLMLSRSIVVNI